MSDDLPPFPAAILEVLKREPGREFSRNDLAILLAPRFGRIVADRKVGPTALSLTIGLLRMRGYPIPKGRYVLLDANGTEETEDGARQHSIRRIPQSKLQPLADAILEVLKAHRGERLFARELVALLPDEAGSLLGQGASRLPRLSNAVSLLRKQGHPIPKGRYILPARS